MQIEKEEQKRYVIAKNLDERSVRDVEMWGFKIASHGNAFLISW